MKRKSRTDPRVSRLANQLQEHLGLKPLDDVMGLTKLNGEAGILCGHSLLFADYFEPRVDLVVYDDDLGTLGLLRVIEGDDVARQVREAVDHASYVRRLLLRDAEIETTKKFPLSVELVLAVGGGVRAMDDVGEALREIARHTPAYVEAVGINTLALSESRKYSLSQLRRAFCWLLRDVKHWFKQALVSTGQSNRKRAIRAIELTEFRLPGVRRLTLTPHERLHLVYGKNGTGKSAFSEAIELSITGKIERLESELEADADARESLKSNERADYYSSVLTNEKAQTNKNGVVARVVLKCSPRSVQRKVTEVTKKPLADGLSATSFRLDDSAMNRLTVFGDRQRSRILFGAFFSDDSPHYQDNTKAIKKAAAAFSELPESIRDSLAPTGSPSAESGDVTDAVIKRFSWVASEQPPDRDAAEDLLPLPWEKLEALSPLSPDLRRLEAAIQKPPTSWKELLEKLDAADSVFDWIGSHAHEIVEDLQQAFQILSRFESWKAVGKGAGNVSFERRLNEFLELSALADLADRRYHAAWSYEWALQDKWKPSGFDDAELLNQMFGFEYPNRLREQRDAWRDRRDQLLSELMEAADTGRSNVRAKGARGNRLALAEIALLDRISHWLMLAEDTESPPLGQTLATALSGDLATAWAGLTLGSGGWWKRLVAQRLQPLLSACQEAARCVENRQWHSPIDRITTFQELIEAYQEVRRTDNELQKTFYHTIMHDQSLNHAINEVMALFTPARWAYEDVRLVLRNDEGALRVEILMGTHQGKAALRLNTAELKLFTMALFLLCSPRVDNPLRFVVLDDPFQHLDELSVASLSRALNSLLKMWPQHWRMLLLLHGLDDFEIVKRATRCAVYRLPWLTPDARETDPIEIPQPADQRDSYLPGTKQHIGDIVSQA